MAVCPYHAVVPRAPDETCPGCEDVTAAARVRPPEGRDFSGGPPLTEAERVRAAERARLREIAAERFSEIDPVSGRRVRSTWLDVE